MNQFRNSMTFLMMFESEYFPPENLITFLITEENSFKKFDEESNDIRDRIKCTKF